VDGVSATIQGASTRDGGAPCPVRAAL